MFKSKKVMLFIFSIMLFLASLFGCANSYDKYNKYSYEFFGTFDTVVQLSGYTTTQKQFDKYSQYTIRRFKELHELFDIYNKYDDINNIKTINDNAGIKPVEVDSQILELLELSIKYNKEVSDKVNIALGPVLNLWHIYRQEGMHNPENAKIPPPNILKEASLLSNISNIEIDRKNNTIYLTEKGMSIDVGAVAKGYATQIISSELTDMGFASFFISSGGNVKTIGLPLGKKKFWSIGLQNPYYFNDMETQENLIDIVYIENNSVVTSGDYQRFYFVEGKKYHHIIDKDTLMPQLFYNAVTVMTPDSIMADFLSTAIFLMPYAEGRNFVDSLPNTEAYWIFADGTIKATKGMILKLKNLGNATNTQE